MKKSLAIYLLIIFSLASCKKESDSGNEASESLTPAPTETITRVPAEVPPIVSSPVDSAVPTEPPLLPTPVTDPAPPPLDTSLPSLAYTFDTNLEYYNFSRSNEEKYKEAAEIVKMVVATEEFRNKVLNHTYGGKKTFVDNRGFTNEQIYQIILEGAEKLQPAKNNQIDAEIELYYAATNTVGYTYPSSKRIWVNTKYFNTYSVVGVSRNLFHEWMHKLGFGHASTWSSSRDYSVPYALGRIVGDIGKNFL